MTVLRDEICLLWERLIGDITNSSVRKEAASHAQAMLSHLEECSECREPIDNIINPADIYLALAEEDHLSQETQKVLDKLLEASSADREAIKTAVTDVMLPSLPKKLSSEMLSIADPLKIFRAIDAVSMTVERALDQENSVSTTLEFASDGSLKTHDREVVPRAQILSEIQRTAAVSTEAANQLVDLVRSAACQYPDLFPELDTNLDHERLFLRLHEGEPLDLFSRWKPLELQSQSAEALRRLKKMLSSVGAALGEFVVSPTADVPGSTDFGFNQSLGMAYKNALAEMAPGVYQLENEAENIRVAISRCAAEFKINKDKFPYYQPESSKVLPAIGKTINLNAPAAAILIVALDNFGNVLRDTAVETDDPGLFCEALESRLSAFTLYALGGRQSPSFDMCLTRNIAEDLLIFESKQQAFGRSFAVRDRIALCEHGLRHIIQTERGERAGKSFAWDLTGARGSATTDNVFIKQGAFVAADNQTESTGILKR